MKRCDLIEPFDLIRGDLSKSNQLSTQGRNPLSYIKVAGQMSRFTYVPVMQVPPKCHIITFLFLSDSKL